MPNQPRQVSSFEEHGIEAWDYAGVELVEIHAHLEERAAVLSGDVRISVRETPPAVVLFREPRVRD